MKSFFKVSLLAATVMLAVGCQKEEAKAAPAPKAAQTATAKAPQFKDANEKAAYAIGVSFAKYLNTSIEKPSSFGITLDKDVVLKGIEDTFKGKETLKQDDIKAALQDLDKRVSAAMQKQAAKKAAVAKKAGDDFRAKFAKEDGVVTTKSGLMYKVMTAGKGAKPAATDTVKVNYKGTLIDGTKFDSSYDRGQPVSFPLNRVIPGWTEGVQLMSVGAKYKFVIPAELAYGAKSTPTIPANSTLVFEVELLKVEKAKTPAPKAAAKKAPAKK